MNNTGFKSSQSQDSKETGLADLNHTNVFLNNLKLLNNIADYSI